VRRETARKGDNEEVEPGSIFDMRTKNRTRFDFFRMRS
jgi:hypothetical protein